MESVKITCRILLVTTLVSLFCLGFVGCKEAAAPKSGEVAPAISCNDVAGEYVSLNQLKNNVVLIYFWSSKCCSDKVKELEPFYLQNKDKGLSIVAIEVGGSKEPIALFAKNNHLTFTNLVDDFDSLSRSYQVIGFPTIFLVDKKGVIQKKISGPIQINQLNKLVSALL
jgi:peroxiredoxin